MEYLDMAIEDRSAYLGKRIRASLASGLCEAALLRPRILRGDVEILPFVSIQEVFNEAILYGFARRQHRDVGDFSHFVRDHAIEMWEIWPDALTDVDDEIYDIDVIRRVTDEWPRAGKVYSYGSVAADEPAAVRMTAQIDGLLHVARRDTGAATLVGQFVVPGPDSASLAEVVSLRLTDDAFADFRATFERIIGAVALAAPKDQTEFSVEVRRSVEEELGVFGRN